jgi:uncharacterized protein (DUF1919 family)
MRIEFLRKIEVYIKSRINKTRLNKKDFTIISNNCFATFIYKKFGLPYQSPFVNLFMFADDYIELLKNFSPSILDNLKFIEKKDSKYQKELKTNEALKDYYPIGLLSNNIELHFLHYKSEQDVLDKWQRRCKKINWNRLIFKFSDGDNCTDEHIKEFDKLDFKNKVCFTAKPYKHFKSVVFIEKYKHKDRVVDEWKSFHKYYDIIKVINSLE